MKKRIILIAGMLMSMFLFAGCAKHIEVTEEEMNIISRYAASMLLKYDVNYRDALKEDATEEDAGKEDTSETGDIQQEEVTGEVSSETTESWEEVLQRTFEEVLSLDGIQITYNGCMFADSYPENAATAGGCIVTAENGSKLAVLKFTLTNTTAEIKSCNILSVKPAFKLNINGMSASASMTILPEDLSTTNEDLAPGVSTEKVLIFQINEKTDEALQNLEIALAASGKSGVTVLPLQ